MKYKDLNLDGFWINDLFKVKIKRNTYVSYYNGKQYGKGIIIYDNKYFILASTHARTLLFWKKFVEIIKGNFVMKKSGLYISNIDGRYSELNGIWVKM